LSPAGYFFTPTLDSIFCPTPLLEGFLFSVINKKALTEGKGFLACGFQGKERSVKLSKNAKNASFDTTFVI
jgi:hypothetical protein